MFWRLISWASVGLLFSVVIQIALKLDLNKRTLNHRPGKCHLIDGIDRGSEAIVLLEQNNSVLVSSGIQYAKPITSDVKGVIFKVDLATGKATQLKITPQTFNKDTLNPHGMSKWMDAKGLIWLYVINHLKNNDQVEKFRYDVGKDTLIHVKSIRDDETMYNMNDLTMVAEDKFFVVNDNYFRNHRLRKIEPFLIVNLGALTYFDGIKGHIVKKGLALPNSPAISPNGKHLYVTTIGGKSVTVFSIDRGQSIPSVNFVHEISLMTSCDNLFVDKNTGHIWSGCHPIAHKVLNRLHNPDKNIQTPSQVVRIRVSEDTNPDDWKIDEVFADDGQEITASTSAVIHEGILVVGTVDHKMIRCIMSK